MAWATGGDVIRQGQLDIPEERAARHPFVDAATSSKSLEPLLVTLLLPQRTDMTLSTGRINELDGGEVEVRIQSGLSPAVCRITDSGVIPEFRVEIG
jgi:hypothetical protein